MSNTIRQWEFKGDLYDDRLGGSVPLRTNYKKHHHHIRTGQDLCASIRAGKYAFPGGYEISYITDDGACLCGDCVEENLYEIIHSIRNDCSDGWLVIASDILHKDSPIDTIYCDHCNHDLGN